MWNRWFTVLLRDFYCHKPLTIQLYSLGFYYNLGLLSKLFVSLCLGWGFSHIFLVASEFLLGNVLLFSCSVVFNPWTVSAPGKRTRLLSPQGFSRQEYWSGLLSSSPGDLPDPEMEFTSAKTPALQVDSLPLSQNICCLQETHFNYEDL